MLSEKIRQFTAHRLGEAIHQIDGDVVLTGLNIRQGRTLDAGPVHQVRLWPLYGVAGQRPE